MVLTNTVVCQLWLTALLLLLGSVCAARPAPEFAAYRDLTVSTTSTPCPSGKRA